MRRKWHYYTNGTDEITVFEDDLIPDGYTLGRKPISSETRAKQSQAAVARGANNKGKKFSDQACKNMSDAKKRFFAEHPDWESPTQWKPGQSAWNKGLPMSDETKAKLRAAKLGTHLSPEALIRKCEREYATKKMHNSFHPSKIETSLKYVLLGFFGYDDLEHQYRDSRYPFNCDLYIKPLDMFIEVNYTWTHGGHPFNPNNLADISKLEEWQERAETSQYYRTAIKVWTEVDPKKLKTAKDNNLNYFMIYDKEDLHDFIRRIQKICNDYT